MAQNLLGEETIQGPTSYSLLVYFTDLNLDLVVVYQTN